MAMKRLVKFLLKLQIEAEEWLSYISAVAIGVMMTITVADVVARRIFHGHVKGSYEYVSLLFVYLIFFGLAIAQRQDAHITFGILYDRLSRKARIPVEGVILALSFVLFSALTWYTAKSAWVNYLMGDTMLGSIQVVTWPSRVGVPVGCGMLALRLLTQIVRLLRTGELYEEAVGRKEVGEER
jgi:TRAP-type C4-dicarboxylate transport system permease small subunit